MAFLKVTSLPLLFRSLNQGPFFPEAPTEVETLSRGSLLFTPLSSIERFFPQFLTLALACRINPEVL